MLEIMFYSHSPSSLKLLHNLYYMFSYIHVSVKEFLCYEELQIIRMINLSIITKRCQRYLHLLFEMHSLNVGGLDYRSCHLILQSSITY